MENIKDFLQLYQDKKFKTQKGKACFNDIKLMEKHYAYIETKKFLEEKYNLGYGFKSLIKEFELPVTYSKIRLLFDFMGIDRRKGNNIVTERLKEFRRDKALDEHKNKTGWFSEGIQESIKNKNHTSRGIQGYYFNMYRQKYVWLRSSWEYIYACWLDSKNIDWDVEVKSFNLKDGKKYRPDFFIYENKKLVSIVEIKGYWKDKTWKYNELSKNIKNLEFSLITNISPYTTNNMKVKEMIQHWKNNRKLKIEIP